MRQGRELLEREEVYIVRGVNGLCCAEDGVGDGIAAAEERGVFDVVDAAIRLADASGDSSGVLTVSSQYVACLLLL